jgi:hypothetical protein
LGSSSNWEIQRDGSVASFSTISQPRHRPTPQWLSRSGIYLNSCSGVTFCFLINISNSS